MEAPDDSDHSRKRRRRTALEIFFNDEIGSTDSEEANFLRASPPPSRKPSFNTTLKACHGECTCCNKITQIINSSYPLTPSNITREPESSYVKATGSSKRKRPINGKHKRKSESNFSPLEPESQQGKSTFRKALLRKLARTAGRTRESLPADFKPKSGQKIRQLYSPEKWLNSKLFSNLCQYDK